MSVVSFFFSKWWWFYVVAFCIIIARIFLGLSQRERETERETREEYSPVPSSSARSLTLSFFLLLSDFTKNIIFFISFKV